MTETVDTQKHPDDVPEDFVDSELTEPENVDDLLEDNETSFEYTESDEINVVGDITVKHSINAVGPSKELCEWEKIRIANIKEREKMIAESKIMDEINEAKRDLLDLHGVDKSIKNNPVTRRKKESNVTVRRSDRIKTHDKDPLENSKEVEDIKLEIKIELVDSNDSLDNNPAETENDLTNSREINELEINNDSEMNDDSELNDDLNLEDSRQRVETVTRDSSDDSQNEPEVETLPRDSSSDASQNDLADETVPGESSDVSQNDQVVSNKRAKKYCCDKCNYTTVDNYHLKRHIEIHAPSKVQCLKCDTVCDSKYQFIEHSKTCFYRCPYFGCSKKFKIDYKFEAHRRNHIKMLRRLI